MMALPEWSNLFVQLCGAEQKCRATQFKGKKTEKEKDRFVLAAAWARNPPEQLLPPARRQQSGI